MSDNLHIPTRPGAETFPLTDTWHYEKVQNFLPQVVKIPRLYLAYKVGRTTLHTKMDV